MYSFAPQPTIPPAELNQLFSSNLLPYSRSQSEFSRDHSSINSQFSITRLQVLLALSQSVDEKNQVAQIGIDAMLKDIAQRISDPDMRVKYSRENLSQRERTRVLAYASPEDLVGFIENLAKLSSSNPDIKKYVDHKLNNAFTFTNLAERIEISRAALITKHEELICSSMLACESFDELKSLVSLVGKAELIKCQSDLIRDLTAYVASAGKIRDGQIPALLTTKPDKQAVKTLEKNWHDALSQRLAALKSIPECLAAPIGSRWGNIFEYEEKFVKSELKSAKTESDRSEILNAAILRLQLSSQYALKLSSSDMLVADAGKWSSKELQDLKITLGNLNQNILLTTPLLTEIQRASMPLRPNVLGARYGNGVIRVFDSTFDADEIEAFYPKISPLQVVLTHELGHSIQLGREGGSVEIDQFTLGQAAFDFDEFIQLGGWTVYLPNSYTITNGGASVKIEGREYPIDRPVKFHGEMVTFLFDGWQLSSYKSMAPFSLRWYSRTTPWEDWAEGFAEYNLMPERLISFAPQKFQYFEDEFGRYTDRKDLQKLLDQRLAQGDN